MKPAKCPKCGAATTDPHASVNGSWYYLCGSWWPENKEQRQSDLCRALQKINELQTKVNEFEAGHAKWHDEVDTENACLESRIALLLNALKGMVTDEKDDPCWYDHHGYCQAHGVNDPCEMAVARQAIKEVEG